jgi:TRAP-type mannitol/chloroaromatic compound transport system, small permease component
MLLSTLISVVRRIAGWMETACLGIAALCLLYMVFVVGFNVLARIVFDATDAGVNVMIPGAIEQVSYLLGVVALAALAVSLSGGMIAVDMLVGRFPPPLRALVARLWCVGILAFALVLVWLFSHETLATFARGEETQDLRIPMFLIYGLYTLECLALAVIALREAFTTDGHHAELS